MKRLKVGFDLTAFALALVLGLAQAGLAAPILTPGTWVNVGPSQVRFGNSPDVIFTMGMAIDPTNPSIIYLCVGAFNSDQALLWKTTDGCATWRAIGKVRNLYSADTTLISGPMRLRIDPKNPQHLYVGCGVRGPSLGFWSSIDGGETFTYTQSWVDWTKNVGTNDVYDVAVDPTDFNHILLSFHSGWSSGGGGVAESKDGGATWIGRKGPAGMGGAGMSVAFLYNPTLKIGNSDTWLVGTQGGGYWRTADGGTTWTKVSDKCIMHGGGTIYYSKTGALYATALQQCIRSTDNGITWTSVGPNSGNQSVGPSAVFGDGNYLYTAQCYGPASFYVSPESDGITWTKFNSQQFTNGPYEMAFDSVHDILYSASWNAGMWALKVSNTTAVNKNLPLKASLYQTSASLEGFKIIDGQRFMVSGKTAQDVQSINAYDVRGKLIKGITTKSDGFIGLDRSVRTQQMIIVNAR